MFLQKKSVSLRVITSFCITLFSNYIFAQAPVANFKSDIQGGCSPVVVNFQDLSSGSPTAWSWKFGNGATSTKQNPSTTFFTPGTYSVTLTATSPGGANTVVKNTFITVYDVPGPAFISDKAEACSPAKIQFADISLAAPNTVNTKWLWDFGNNVSSTQKNPENIYRSPGNYSVTLTVTNDKGCSKLITKPNFITASPGIAINFSNSLPTVCSAPALITFTNSSTGPGTLTYKWDFGDGTKSTSLSPRHAYSADNVFDVTLIVNSSLNCTDTLKKNAIVKIGGIATDFTEPVICAANGTTLLNASAPNPRVSTWEFEDGSIVISKDVHKTFSRPGSYNVKLKNVYDYCTDSITKTVTVHPLPTVRFTADSVSCKIPFRVDFKNLTVDGATYLWKFGDGATSAETNPTHIYNNYGNFTVKLYAVSPNGCNDSLEKEFFIRVQEPRINFDNIQARGCIPFDITLSASVAQVDKVSDYFWDLGDGTSSTLKNPHNIYPVQGTYPISLTITTTTGCTVKKTVTEGIKVGSKPKADFTVNPILACASQYFQFTDMSVPADEYLWNFGDGSTSTGKNPSYRYNKYIGWFDVRLIAFNNGCPDTINKVHAVHTDPPIALFSAKPNCLVKPRLEYNFTDLSVGAKTWHWDFGDGTTSDIKEPTHVFPAFANYVVTLTVTNGICSFSYSLTVKVLDIKLSFSGSPLVSCKNELHTFTSTSNYEDLITGYVWDFGDNSRDFHRPGEIVTHVYASSGYYTVKVFYDVALGCSDSTIKINYVRINGPKTKFNGLNTMGCKNLKTEFIDETITDGINPVVKWEWNFGDGNSQTYSSAPFDHVYKDPGVYTVKLRTTDAYGCTDDSSFLTLIKVSDIHANWDANRESCPGASVTFINQTTGSYSFSNFWDVGNGSTFRQAAFKYAYPDKGLYTIKLKVKDVTGCEDSLTKNEYVKIDIPVADFTANNLNSYCTPFEVKLTNTSSFYSSWSWDLGNVVSSQPNPNNYYTSPGDYKINLTVYSPGGCVATVQKNVHIYKQSDAKIDYSPLTGCRPLQVDLNAFSQLNADFIWDFGDGNIKNTSENTLSHIYENFGSYLPKVILNEPGGCVITLTGKDPIDSKGIITKFNMDHKFFCDSGYVSIIDSTTFNDPIQSYEWNWGDGSIEHSSVPNAPIHHFTHPGNYTVSLTAVSESGCTDKMELPDPVRIVLRPLINISGDSEVCVYGQMIHNGEILRNDNSSLVWDWRFPNGQTSSSQIPPEQKYIMAGNFTVNAIAINSSGCRDTSIKKITVFPLPAILVPTTITIQPGFPITIPATYSQNVESYNWSFSNSLSCTDCATPVANPKFDTKYNVAVTDINGCTSKAELQILVLCKDNNLFVPNTFSPNNDGINEVFYLRGKGITRVKSMQVFNRWGEIVFEKRDFPVNDQSFGWDGTFKGVKPQTGVYVYQIDVFCENNQVIHFQGNVTLLQ